MSLPYASPADMGLDPEAIARTVERMAEVGTELHGIVVLRHGHVVAGAEADPWTSDQIRLIYSLSKTFCSAAVGIAVEEGRFAYDDLVVDLLPELVDETVGPVWRTVRVRDLLAMASGHTDETLFQVASSRVELGEAQLARFLRLEPGGTPGVTFAYNQPCTWTLSRLVERHAGRDVLAVLREKVFPAIGAGKAFWQPDSDGVPIGFSGLHVTTKTIASFFQLLLDDGVRDGERLLPREWVEGHRRKAVETARAGMTPDWAAGYGWQVWMASHGYRGDGAIGQFGIVLPEQDVVVAITSWSRDMQATLDVLWSELLPGVDRAVTPGGAEHLATALEGLRVPTAGTGWASEPESAGWEGADSNGDRLQLVVDLVYPQDQRTAPQDTEAVAAAQDADPERDDRQDADRQRTGSKVAHLTWTDHTGTTHELTAGHDRWEPAELRWGDRWLAVSSSAAYGESGWTIRMAVLHTPHLVTWTLPRGSDRATFTWSQAPLGPWLVEQLAQPFPH